MNQKKKKLLVGWFAAGMVLAGTCSSFAKEAEPYGASLESKNRESAPVAVDVTAVYGKTAKLGSFVPLKVSLYGQSETAFTGTLFISTLESNNDDGVEEYGYSYPVEVSFGETKTMELYVPLGQKSGKIYLTLKDKSNRTMGETSMDFDISREENRILVGVLEKDPGKLEWLDGVSLNYGMLTSKRIEIQGEDFPEDSRGLSMFDVLIVNDYDCRKFDNDQKEAVMDWVSDGGVLLVGTGRNAEKTLGILDEKLKITTREPETVWVGMGTEYAGDSPVETEVRLTYTEPVITGASEQMVTDGTPLLKMKNYGKG